MKIEETVLVYQTESKVWKVDGYYDKRDALNFMTCLKVPTVRRVMVCEPEDWNKKYALWENPLYYGEEAQNWRRA